MKTNNCSAKTDATQSIKNQLINNAGNAEISAIGGYTTVTAKCKETETTDIN